MTRRQGESRKPRAAIDTDVWLSGLAFGGAPGQVLELFIDGTLIAVVSEELLSELRRKISQKFLLFMPRLGLLEASIRKDATVVRLGGATVRVCRDPDDDKFLETALIGRCSYVISGDKDLLSLGRYQGVQIVSPADFLEVNCKHSRPSLGRN